MNLHKHIYEHKFNFYGVRYKIVLGIIKSLNHFPVYDVHDVMEKFLGFIMK